jgi:hypothetical protein
MSGANGGPHFELVLDRVRRRFVLLVAEAHYCTVGEALAMVIDEAIDGTESKHLDGRSLRWLLEHADAGELDPSWVASFGGDE